MESTAADGKENGMNGSGFKKHFEEAESAFSDIAGTFKMSDETKAKLNDAVDASTEFVRKHPVETVLGTAAVAFILGYLLRGNRS